MEKKQEAEREFNFTAVQDAVERAKPALKAASSAAHASVVPATLASAVLSQRRGSFSSPSPVW